MKNKKKKNNCGAILVFSLFMAFLLFSFSLFVFKVAEAHVQVQKNHNVLEATLLSSLRLRAEGLERIAQRWQEFGPLLQLDPEGTIMVPSDHWDDVVRQMEDLEKGIRGYKARIRGAITVVAEANGIPRAEIQLAEEAALNLGVEAQTESVTSSDGRQQLVEGAWYQRSWSPDLSLAQPDETCRFERPSQFGSVVIPQKVSGRLRWDVSTQDPIIMTQGNGGFPRQWSEAALNGELNPHRFPFFTAETIP